MGTISNESFATAYAMLNDAQKAAVEAIDGPVLVVAGPGTGKTQLLGTRVANILRRTDTDAGSILCLTFTNKAATNMRERLQQLVGNDARHVMVKTFHSFAAEIMNMYPDYFWSGARLTVAPDAVQLEIIESNLSELPLANPLSLKFAGQFTAVKDVQQALKLVKEAGLTPDQLRAVINLNIAYLDRIEPAMIDILAPTLSHKRLPDIEQAIAALPGQGLNEQSAPLLDLHTVLQEGLALAIRQDEPTGKTTQTGAWKRRWLQTVNGQKGMFDERRRNAWWLAVADVYELYRQTLHRRGYYDYADMLVEVITQMEQHADLRASVQERFLYVLIDEFQDTNAAQLRLSQLVADHVSNAGNPNIMAVGDDDQSIYKFNGAELNNMLSFRRTYPTAQLFVLTENYRSTQAVLSSAKQVIAQAADRLVTREPELNKELVAVNPPQTLGSIQHVSYPSREHQFSNIARLLQGEQAKHAGSIAVLARGHDSLRQLAGLLGELGVPVSYERSNDILSHPAVQQIIRLSQLIIAMQNGSEADVNYHAAKILRHPMWRIDPLVLWQLTAQNFQHSHWLDSLIKHTNRELQAIGHWLLWLAVEADSQPLAIMLEYFIGLRAGEHLTSPLREYYLSGEVNDDYVAALSAIKLLRSLAQEFAHSESASLADFVAFTGVIKDNNQIIADDSPFVSRQDAVELLTVYKAKGLEFDTVFVVDAVEKNWQPKAGSRRPPANLPLQPAGDNYDDYARLMYVALTRAKHTIYVSSYRADDTGREVLATPLITATDIATRELDEQQSGEAITVIEEALTWPRLPQRDEQQILRDRLEGYSLSATHLLNFLDVTTGGPQHFLEQNLLKLPMAQTAALAFGNAMHSALEQAQKRINTDAFILTTVLDDYERALASQRLPISEVERYTVHGQNILRQLFGPLHLELPKGSLPEQALRDVRFGSVCLDGKLDRIDVPSPDSLTIVDYKTGKPLPGFDTRDRTKQVKAWRHQTQLTFYTLLVTRSGRFRGIKHIDAKMVYLEAENQRGLERSFQATPEALERLEKLITIVWQHIIDLNLPDTSHYTADRAGIEKFEQDLLDGTI